MDYMEGTARGFAGERSLTILNVHCSLFTNLAIFKGEKENKTGYAAAQSFDVGD